MDDFPFSDSSTPFYFLLIEFHCNISISLEYYYIMFIIIVICLGSDWLSGLLSKFTPLFLPSSISLSYLIVVVPMSECLGKHPCKSPTCPIGYSHT